MRLNCLGLPPIAVACCCVLLAGFCAQPAQAVTRGTPSSAAALPVLQVGVLLQAPYAQYDVSTRLLQGADIEVMNRLAAIMHVQLVWHTYSSARAFDTALQAHQIDLAPGQLQTPQGLHSWLYSEPVLRVPNKVVGLRGRGRPTVDLEQLPLSARLALVSPSPLASFMAQAYPVLQQRPQVDERAALSAVMSRQAEYAVVDEAQLAGLLREAQFAQLVVVGDAGYTRLLRIAVRADLPQWQARVDTALQQLPPRFLSQVYARWMLPDYPPLSQQIGVWRALSALLALLLLAGGVFGWGRARQLRELTQRLEAQRLQLEQQEAEREELRLPQITLDHSSVGILWVSWDSRVRYANPASAQLLAAAQADMLLGRRLAEGYPALNGERWRALWNRLRGVETLPSFEAQCLRLDGVRLPLDITLSFVRFASAEYLVVFMTDASERYRAREALKENELNLAASRQSLRALAAHLESAREEEKAHLAREVHDELGQHLTVLRLEMSMCEIGFGHLDPKLQDRLHSMKRLIEQTFQIVRDVASALRPPILDAGIASAVEWQMRRFEQRSQIPVLVTVPEAPLALSDEQAIGLFRILQEALTNVLRHAQANSVSLLLESSADGLLLCLSDDGIGFDPQARRTEVSFGLVGMQERVLLLGGRLEIDSRPLHGTTLKVWVPLNESEPS